MGTRGGDGLEPGTRARGWMWQNEGAVPFARLEEPEATWGGGSLS